MSEYLNSTPDAVLVKRADALANSYQRMVRTGSNLHLLRDSLQTPAHEDFLLVQLGLKPSAVILYDVFDALHPSQKVNYIKFLPQRGEIMVNEWAGAIWNTRLVSSILDENADIANTLVKEDSTADFYFTNPTDPNFGNFLGYISDDEASQRANLLSGLLHGYPREAVEPFANYRLQVFRLIDEIAERAESVGVSFLEDGMYSFRMVQEDMDFKNQLIALAEQFRFGTPELIDFIRRVRSAQAPGFKYSVVEDYPTEHEQLLTERFARSKVMTKLNRTIRGIDG